MHKVLVALAAVWLIVPSGASAENGASSLTDVEVWTELPAGKPIIDRGPEGAWDHMAVDNPFLLKMNGKLHCFYEGQDKPFSEGGHERIGLATSEDGLTWRKHPGNPIIDVGMPGDFDSLVAKLPVVTHVNGVYYLYYSGRDGKTKQIGLASSRDLTHWVKHAGNPVLSSRPDAWDRFVSTYPAPPEKRDGKYYLLFRGMASLYTKQGAGLAVSNDLLHWERAADEAVIPVTEEIASFAFAQDGAGYAGIAQAPTRRYWISDDLQHWTPGPQPSFTGKRVDTLSNPIRQQGVWMVVYEQEDRIYRAIGKP